jgi:hypothetical protein
MSDTSRMAESKEPEPTPAVDDDLHRQYREALDRKRQRATQAAAAREKDHPHALASNTKRQRTFRRKSG